MKIKNVIYALLAVTLLWSCGKDDGPSTPVKKTPTISSFSPTSGPVGTQVTIKGTNFATKKADNTVKFGTVKATVDDATATQLKVTVPVGATTSKITVTVDGETSTSASGFTVTEEEEEEEEKNTPPEFGEESYEFEAEEDIGDKKEIGTVKATDTDGDKLAYGISNNDNGLFEIGEDSGEITLADGKNLDFETTDKHTITVTVTDGTNTVEIEVTIKVTNVNDTLQEDPESFVTTWTTPSDNFELEIGVNDGFVYNFTINWGDGTEEELAFQGEDVFTHVYETAGTYTVAISAIQPFKAIEMREANKDSQDALTSIDQWGSGESVYNEWGSFKDAFYGCGNMKYNATDTPDLTHVTDMSAMFYEAESFDGDLSGWNVGEVTDMSFMFSGAKSFNGDISGWDTEDVTNMKYMFTGATSFNGNISNWKTGKVTDMSYMFVEATSFNQNLGGWTISSVTKMNHMLDGSGMSSQNYDDTLAGWAGKGDTPDDITFGAEGIFFCNGGARAALINQKGWTISDSGQGQNCP